MNSAPDANVSMGRLGQILFQNKKKIILCALAVLGGAAAITFLGPKSYLSQAKLLVRLGRENVTLDPTATLGQAPVVAVPTSREGDILSVIESIRSQQLLEKVIDAVGPHTILGTEPPESAADISPGLKHRALRTLNRNLVIDAIKKSNVILIAYEGPSPEQAQVVVNKVVDFYLDLHATLHRTPRAEKFLGEQLARLWGQLATLDKELRDLKNETGLMAPESQRLVLVSRIGRLEEERLQAATSLAATEAEVRALRDKLASLARTQVTAQTSGAVNRAAEGMREQLYALQLKEMEYLVKFPDRHPDIQLLQKQISAAKGILAQEPSARDQVTQGPNRLHEEASLALLRQEPLLESLQAKHRILGEQLAKERLAMKVLNDDGARIQRLQRQVDLQESLCRKYAENLEQAQIDGALKLERITNLSIVQSATSDIKPHRPNVLLNMTLGLFVALAAGLGLACAAEYHRASRKAAA